MLFKHRFYPISLFFVLISFLAVAVLPVNAITRVVTDIGDSGTGTLREEISLAGAGDIITFDVVTMGGSSISLSSEIIIDDNITIDGGTVITIAGSAERVFTIAAGRSVTLNDITIQSGVSGANGGNILNLGALTLDGATVTGGNATGSGGNIYHSGSALTINNSRILSGGAVDGGNIYATGNLTVTNSNFDNAFASGDGAGVYQSAGTSTYNQTSFYGNQTPAGSGGGIYVASGTLNLLNTTFASNDASSGSGGGVYVDAGTANISFSTFSGNSGNGGAIANNTGTVTLSANILWGNNNPFAPECAGTFGNSGANVVQDLIGCILSDTINTDPTFSGFSTTGAGIGYFSLTSGSSAENTATSCAGNIVDIIGAPRPMGSACDMGSYEIPTPIGNIVETGPFYVPKDTPFSQQFTTDGSAGLTWSVIGATALPTGLTLDPATGIVSGTVGNAFANDTYSVQIQAQAYDSSTASATFDFIVVDQLALSPTFLDDAIWNQDYTSSGSGVTATGGTGVGYTYALDVTSDPLPTGLSLQPDGDIAGTTTAIGSYNIVITVTDTGSGGLLTLTQAYTLDVVYPPVLLSVITAPADAVLGQTYGAGIINIIVSGGDDGPYSVVVNTTSSPDFVMDGTGNITGTATTLTDWTANITVSDGAGNNVTGDVTLNIINPPPSFTPAAGALPTGFGGVAYSQIFTGIGGTVPYTYSLFSGTPPTGYTITGDTFSVPSPTTGNYSFIIQLTDSSLPTPQTVTRAYTLAILPDITVLPASPLPDATAGVAYSATFVGSGGAGAPFTFSQTGLPPTLSLASDGALTGTPTTAETINFTVTVTDSASNSRLFNYTLKVNLGVLPTTLPNGTVGNAYSQSINAIGATGGVTFSTPDALPAGLTLSSAGLISGTPTATGTTNFTVNVIDGSGNTGTRAYSITVGEITITPTMLADGAFGVAYTPVNFSAMGGTGSYTYTVTAGLLPTGMTLSGTGDLTGTPTQNGTFNFTVTATDSTALTGTQSLSLTITPATLTVNPATVSFTNGTPFSQVFTATGGNGTYSFAVTGTLPTGVTFDIPSATLSGTPTTDNEPYSFTITATDTTTTTAQTGLRVYAGNVAPLGSLAITPTTLTNGAFGVAYGGETFVATGGTAPYTYAVTLGALPTGITLSTGGSLSGTPTQNGTFNFTITATDSTIPTALTGTQSLSLTITPATLTVNPATVSFTNGTPFSQVFSATGGNGTYSFAVTGTLPTGVTLTGDTLSGTPTIDNESYNFTIIATDTTTTTVQTGSQVYTGTVAPLGALSITPTTLTNGAFGVAYAPVNFVATGGTTPYTYAVTLGALPTGMTLSTGGSLSGTPTQNGTFNFTITATDSTIPTALTGTQSLSLTITPATLTVNPATVSFANGTPFSQVFTATGGNGTYSFAVTGTLPTGVTLTGDTLSGTPTVNNEAYSFTITATDTTTTTAQTGSQVYTGTVAPLGALSITPTTLTNGAFGVAYVPVNFVATGVTAPYTYAVTLGALPTGITLSTGGSLSGTPTQNGTFNFTITATDSTIPTALTGTQSLSLTITPATLTVNPATVSFANGTPFSQVFTATGGNGTYSFAVTGTLPTGVTLTGDTLSGTPTVNNEAYSFTITATDTTTTTAQTGSQVYTGTVAPLGALSITPTTLTNGAFGVAYVPVNFVATGGTAPYTYAVTMGALPTGMTLSTGGSLSGTPTQNGTFNFTITATDSTIPTALTGTQSLSLTITPATLTVDPATVSFTNGTPFNQVFTATGGNGTYSFAVTGTLPTGVTLTGDTLSGTPTVNNEAYSFTITATDTTTTTAQTGSRFYTGTVAPLSTVLNFTPTTLPAGTVGVAYTTNLTPTGGTGTGYAFSGTAPSGLILSLTGNITGFPTTAGTFTFNVTLTDSALATVTQTITLIITAPVSISITPTTLADATVGSAYLQTLTATGGTSPYTFTGAAPTGLTLASNGQISGVPTVAGTYNFNVTATDSTLNSRTQTITLVVNGTIVNPTGAGFSSSPAPSSTIDFGTLAIGATGTVNLVISEIGISTLNISVPTDGILTGPNPSDFILSGTIPPFSIADGGASVTLTIQCKPSAEGVRIATLNINTNDTRFPIATYTLQCTGSGTAQTPTDANATPEPQFKTSVEVIQVRGLALRTGPYLGASMLAIARPGNIYEVFGRNTDEGIYTWYLIRVNGILGWSSGRYLQVSGDLNIPFVGSIFDELDNSKDYTVRGNTLDNLNLHRRPSLRVEPFMVIPWGGEVKVLGSTMQGGVFTWLYVEYDGQRGWVYAPWIRVTTEIGIWDLPIR